jgi:hypothetical protein
MFFVPSDQILYLIISAVLSSVLGFWAAKASNRSTKEEGVLSDVVKDVAQLKVSSVSESRVREIIKDAIEPTGSDVKEIKLTVHELSKTLNDIQLRLATEIAFKRGKGQRDES